MRVLFKTESKHLDHPQVVGCRVGFKSCPLHVSILEG